MHKSDYNDSVFINCPFDPEYKPMLDAVVFAVFDCGFIARCTMEEENASQIRIEKIYNIIFDCRYGVHDISRTELDPISGLPRFNMALELGIFLGAKRFGQGEHQKRTVSSLIESSIGIRNTFPIFRAKTFMHTKMIPRRLFRLCVTGSATPLAGLLFLGVM